MIQIRPRDFGGERINAVNARDLHAFLEVTTRFDDWIRRRIEEFGFQEHRDFEVFLNSEENPRGGRPAKEYALTLDMAKELSMVERTEKGKEARLYFIDQERIAQRASLTTKAKATSRIPAAVQMDRLIRLYGFDGTREVLRRDNPNLFEGLPGQMPRGPEVAVQPALGLVEPVAVRLRLEVDRD